MNSTGNAIGFIQSWIADARGEIACTFMPRTNGRVKYSGIVADARRLGCSRIHLYLVLTGRRTSHSLRKRYQQLKWVAA